MDNQKDKTRIAYIRLFITFSNSVERYLKRIIAGFIVLLIIMQLLLQSSEIRFFLTTIGKLEGTVEQAK